MEERTMRVRNRLRSGGSRLSSRGRTHRALTDLVYAMCRQAEDLRLELPDGTMVPSQVQVRLAPADLAALAVVEHRLASALGAHMCRHAGSRGWFVQTWPKVRFSADPAVASGASVMEARYLDGQTAEEAYWKAAFWSLVDPLRGTDGIPREAGPDPRPAARRGARVWLPAPRRGQC
jgi:hypothetical protein